jgi:hypothetical protein
MANKISDVRRTSTTKDQQNNDDEDPSARNEWKQVVSSVAIGRQTAQCAARKTIALITGPIWVEDPAI